MKSFLHREKNIYPSIKEYVSGPSSQRVFQFLHTHKPTINTHTPNRYEYRDTWNNVSFKLIFKTMLSVYYLAVYCIGCLYPASVDKCAIYVCNFLEWKISVLSNYLVTVFFNKNINGV